MKNKPALVPLLGFALLAVLFAVALLKGHDPAILPSALIGKQAPSLDGLPGSEKVKELRAAAKDAPLAVNIFASWCVTCASEQGTLLQMQKDGVTVVGIGYKDSARNIEAWLEKHGNPFVAVVLDEQGRAAIDWGVYGVPETYFIATDGTIRYKHVGAMSMEDYEKTLKPVLEGMKK
jgi:cytochrome c biogenesis protein CcmG/thiol:disulfide interchange protein DsbE